MRVLMINENLHKSLASRNGNEILVWSQNNPRNTSKILYSLTENFGPCQISFSQYYHNGALAINPKRGIAPPQPFQGCQIQKGPNEVLHFLWLFPCAQASAHMGVQNFCIVCKAPSKHQSSKIGYIGAHGYLYFHTHPIMLALWPLYLIYVLDMFCPSTICYLKTIS